MTITNPMIVCGQPTSRTPTAINSASGMPGKTTSQNSVPGHVTSLESGRYATIRTNTTAIASSTNHVMSACRGTQGSFDGPTAFQAHLDSLARDPKDARPVSDRARRALKCQPVVFARVVRLLVSIRPSAIALLVIAVRIDTVNRMTRRTRPHVAQERLKGGAPLIGHADAAPAVMFPALLLAVVAARFGSAPRNIFARAVMLMLGDKTSEAFATCASATDRVPEAQVFAGHDSRCAAIAAATPKGFAVVVGSSSSDRNKTAEPLAQQIDRTLSQRVAVQTTATLRVAAAEPVRRAADDRATRASALPRRIASAFHVSTSKHCQACESPSSYIFRALHGRIVSGVLS